MMKYFVWLIIGGASTFYLTLPLWQKFLVRFFPKLAKKLFPDALPELSVKTCKRCGFPCYCKGGPR